MDIGLEKLLRACILTIPGIGSQRLRCLIAHFGSAVEAYKAEKNDNELGDTGWVRNFFEHKHRMRPEEMEKTLSQKEIDLVIPAERHYPCLLAECSDAPPLLFFQGELTPDEEAIAVVGARKATPYGKAAARHIAGEIVRLGYTVVSGLARGIDAEAHKGALQANGKTWAFLAGGLDKIYPPENMNLAEEIRRNGALLSEYPPGLPPEAGQFPARNRLISGSARGVVIVEAARKSGSLITADFALEQGREVFAVPGPIFSEMSSGTHALIKLGAKLVEHKDDIRLELAGSWGPKENNGNKSQPFRALLQEQSRSEKVEDNKINSCAEWQKILDCLSDIPLHIDRLTAMCDLSAPEIALGLLELQLAGRIVQLPGQQYVLQR